jgi:hypothetical protein
LRIEEDEMGKYGEAAIHAASLVAKGKAASPIDAWKQAMAQIFRDSESSQNKGCPRATFLGLCENGLVVAVPAGKYTRSADNKRYAVEAVRQLTVNPDLVQDHKKLWYLVAGGTKKENSQMDVVTALWREGLIARK